METRDHLLLAKWLIQKEYAGLSRRFIAGLKFGSVFPDRNPLTYFRGISGKQGLHGHNAEITEKSVGAVLDCLMTEGASRGYFCGLRLGIALHYLADAFTYPHHKYYAGSLADHIAYEASLHRAFVRYLGETPLPVWKCSIPFSVYLGEMLRFYRKCAGSPLTDCRFIALMCEMAFKGAVNGLEREEERYENSDYNGFVSANR